MRGRKLSNMLPFSRLLWWSTTTRHRTEFFSYIGTVQGGAPVTGLDPFYHVFENLYVVPVPTTKGVEAIIEDLFDPAVKKPINGRTFIPATRSST